VKERGAERGDVELHVRKNAGDGERMGKVEVAGLAALGTMLFGGKIVSAAEQIEIVARAIAANFVHQLDKLQVEHTLSNGIAGGFAFRTHGFLILRPNKKSFTPCAQKKTGWLDFRQPVQCIE